MILETTVIFGVLLLCVFLWLFIDNISSCDTSKYTIIICYFGILTCTLPIIILPLDIVSNMSINVKNPQINILILRFWQITYFFLFILCWIIYPVLFEYELCGEFDHQNKLRSSLERNKNFWFIQFTFFLIFLIIYVTFFDRYNFKLNISSIFIAIGHFWGMIQIVFLWGFGLVAIPYKLKSKLDNHNNISNLKENLNNMYFILNHLDDWKAINTHEIMKVRTKLRHIYSRTLDKNIKERTNEMLIKINNAFESDFDNKEYFKTLNEINTYIPNNLHHNQNKFNLVDIVKLNREMKVLLAEKRRIHNQWLETLISCWDFEDKLHCRENFSNDENISFLFFEKHFRMLTKEIKDNHITKNTFNSSKKNDFDLCIFFKTESQHIGSKNCALDNFYTNKRVSQISLSKNCFYMFKYGYFRNFFYLITLILSFGIIIAEATIYFPKINISFFSHAIKMISRLDNIDNLKVILIYLICQLLLIYVYLCTFWWLLTIKLPKKYGIYFKKQTDGPCIVFFSQFLCKLSTSLCFHYLSIIRIDNTSFNLFYGKPMQFLPIMFGKNFNSLYFPILVVLLFTFNLFNLKRKVIRSTEIYFLFFDYYVIDEQSNESDEKIAPEFQEIVFNGMKISQTQKLKKQSEELFQLI